MVEHLVDKHLFFQSSFRSGALSAGSPDVSFKPVAPREFYRDRFILELITERGVSDPALRERANDVYRTFFDLFDADSYGESLAAFIQVVLRAWPASPVNRYSAPRKAARSDFSCAVNPMLKRES